VPARRSAAGIVGPVTQMDIGDVGTSACMPTLLSEGGDVADTPRRDGRAQP